MLDNWNIKGSNIGIFSTIADDTLLNQAYRKVT